MFAQTLRPAMAGWKLLWRRANAWLDDNAETLALGQLPEAWVALEVVETRQLQRPHCRSVGTTTLR